MYRKRRAASGTRVSKRRSTYAKGSKPRYRIARMSRGMFNASKTYYFRRNCTLTGITIDLAAGDFLNFQLAQLPNASEFTNLFDSYRINKVVVKFMPELNQMYTGITNSSNVPLIYTAIDYDGGAAATSADDIQQYASCKMYPANRAFTRVITPRTASPIYRSGASSGYMQNPARQWIDCQYSDVQHYGLLYWHNAPSSTHMFFYRVEAVFYIAFKNVR